MESKESIFGVNSIPPDNYDLLSEDLYLSDEDDDDDDEQNDTLVVDYLMERETARINKMHDAIWDLPPPTRFESDDTPPMNDITSYYLSIIQNSIEEIPKNDKFPESSTDDEYKIKPVDWSEYDRLLSDRFISCPTPKYDESGLFKLPPERSNLPNNSKNTTQCTKEFQKLEVNQRKPSKTKPETPKIDEFPESNTDDEYKIKPVDWSEYDRLLSDRFISCPTPKTDQSRLFKLPPERPSLPNNSKNTPQHCGVVHTKEFQKPEVNQRKPSKTKVCNKVKKNINIKPEGKRKKNKRLKQIIAKLKREKWRLTH